MVNKQLPRLCDNKSCTGCLACVNACNIGALSITKDEEGFYRPQIDSNKCVRCGLCEKSCPVISSFQRHEEDNARVYAAWHNDAEIRSKSTSGGAFTALAQAILNRGGVVFGAAYDDEMQIIHIEAYTIDDLEKLRLSKYAQSFIGDTFKRVKQRLCDGLMVMYVGTPCQIAGLKNYLHKDYENLVLVDFICHGVPSIDLFQYYILWLEKKYGKVNHINFRDKRKGWYDSLRVITTDDTRKKVMRGFADNYWVGFNNNNNTLQESCYNCGVQGFPRCSDITIADFWGIGKNIPFAYKDEIEKGVSMIVINNKKVSSLLEEASVNMQVIERTISEAIEKNRAAVQPCARPKNRNTIYKDMRVLDYESLCKKYMLPTMKQRAVKIFREYLPFQIIKFIRLLNHK